MDWIWIGLGIYGGVAVIILLAILAGLNGRPLYLFPLVLVCVFWPIWGAIWLISVSTDAYYKWKK